MKSSVLIAVNHRKRIRSGVFIVTKHSEYNYKEFTSEKIVESVANFMFPFEFCRV